MPAPASNRPMPPAVLPGKNAATRACSPWWKPRSRARAGYWWALFGSLSLSVTSLRAAPELFVSLRYELESGLEGCPSEGQFRRAVGEQLGYDPFRDDAPHRVVAHAEPTEDGIEGRVEWEDSHGKREGERRLSSQSRDCAEFARGMAFAIAVQIQLLSASPPESTAPPAVTPSPLPEPAPSAKEARALPKPRSGPAGGAEAVGLPNERARWGGLVGLGPSIATGVSPKVSALGRLFGTVRYDAFSLELGAEASLPVTKRWADTGGFRSSVAMATLAPCVHVQRFSGCGVAKLGRMWVHGLGVDEARSRSGVLGQAGVRLVVSQSLGRHMACMLHAEVLGTPTRWTVAVNHVGVWTVPPAAFVGGIDAADVF